MGKEVPIEQGISETGEQQSEKYPLGKLISEKL
jgi:hypothetical protein